MYQERKNAYEVHTKYLKVDKKIVSEMEEQVTPTFKTSLFIYYMWDGCDHHKHQTWNYLVKEYHLYTAVQAAKVIASLFL